MTTRTALPRDIATAFKPAFDVHRMSAPGIGQRMPDGTVYAGISPDTGRAMYTTPGDTGFHFEWATAMEYARLFGACGRDDWRVPTGAELNKLFTHCAGLGKFNRTGEVTNGWYWSSTENGSSHVWMQCFRDGGQRYTGKRDAASLRCVRG